MSSWWEFIKKHRGKLMLGTAAVGSVIALQQILKASRESHRHDVYGESDQFRVRARKNYVFDSNQRACDDSILSVIPAMRSKIQKRFDVEKLTELLKSNAELGNDERIAIWQQIKVSTLARVIAVAYSFSLLIVAIKSQISILTSQICAHACAYEDNGQPTWLSQLLPISLRSYWTHLNQSSGSASSVISEVDDHAHQIFLQCISYFTSEGVEKLFDYVERVCKEELLNVDLKAEYDSERLRMLLEGLKRRMESLDSRHFSYLIVPRCTLQDAFALPHSGHLQALLDRLVETLESSQCKEVSRSIVDYYLHAVTQFVARNSTSENLPFARMLPLVADSFETIGRSGFDSPLQNALCSSDLHELTVRIFSLPPVVSASYPTLQ